MSLYNIEQKQVAGGGSGSSLQDSIDITYLDLLYLQTSATLEPGQSYRIVDFRTTYRMNYMFPTVSDVVEPLIVKAVNINRLSADVYSETYPHDIILYSLTDNSCADPLYFSGDSAWTLPLYGRITYREDTVRNIRMYQDWRHIKHRVWETEVGNGLYYSYFEVLEADWQDVPTFPQFRPDQVTPAVFDSISVDDYPLEHLHLQPVIFYDDTEKVVIGTNQDPIIINGGYDLVIGSCSSVVSSGYIYKAIVYKGIINSAGTIESTVFNVGCNITLAAGGSIRSCMVMSGYAAILSGANEHIVIGDSVINKTIDILHADLVALGQAGSLVAGQKYRITDFQSSYILPIYNFQGVVTPENYYGGEVCFGPIEPLIVTATTPSTLDTSAVSSTFPTDIIRYNIDYASSIISGYTPLGNFGRITYREDPKRNIISHHDWRNIKVRLVESVLDSWRYEDTLDLGAPYKDFYMLNGNEELCSNVKVGLDFSGQPDVLLLGDADKVSIGDSSDACIILGTSNDVSIAPCCDIKCLTDVSNLTVLSSSNLTFRMQCQNVLCTQGGVGYVFWGIIQDCSLMISPVVDIYGDHIHELIGYPIGLVKDITHLGIRDLIADGLLIPGQQYRITDFCTTNLIPDTSEVNVGPSEPLIVTAYSANALMLQARSELYPQDIIRYEVEPQATFLNRDSIQFGRISYREDTLRGLSAHQDWRHIKVRRWEDAIGSGVFMWYYNQDADPLRAYQDFTMFNELVDNRNTHVGMGYATDVNVVFQNGSDKVSIGAAADPCTFGNGLQDVLIGTCSAITAYGGIGQSEFEASNTVELRGNCNSTTFGSGAGGTYLGGLTNCQVMSGFTNGFVAISGDHTGELIGYPGWGVNTTYTTQDSKVVTVENGIITSVV